MIFQNLFVWTNKEILQRTTAIYEEALICQCHIHVRWANNLSDTNCKLIKLDLNSITFKGIDIETDEASYYVIKAFKGTNANECKLDEKFWDTQGFSPENACRWTDSYNIDGTNMLPANNDKSKMKAMHKYSGVTFNMDIDINVRQRDTEGCYENWVAIIVCLLQTMNSLCFLPNYPAFVTMSLSKVTLQLCIASAICIEIQWKVFP